MSLKAELEAWASALNAYDEENFEKSLELFSRIADTSKILFNMGLIYATIGDHELAVEKFIEATGLDSYLAVAYFQCGVSNFLLTRYDLAYRDFDEALLYLRGNQNINYEQLGLKFRLFSAEVLFNKGLTQVYMGRVEEGLQDMREAVQDKVTDEHNVIDDAISDRGEGYTVFSIPVGVLYRPSEKKLKNAITKVYTGKPVLIAAADARDTTTGFTGIANLRKGVTPTGVFMEQDQFTGTSNSLARSASAPPPAVSKLDNTPREVNLGRSQSTLNVPSDARQRTSGLPLSGPSIRRSPSPAPSAGREGSVRGLNVNKTESARAPSPAPAPRAPSPSPAPRPRSREVPVEESRDNRVTEFYDDYLDSYGAEDPVPPVPPMPPMPPQVSGHERIAAWAKSNANPPRQAPPPSTYAPSSYGGGRRMTRRSTTKSRYTTRSYEDEEGYVSGEYDDGPYELLKIRVKLHYQGDIRGMAINPDMFFDDFMDNICKKFGKRSGGLVLQFKDEDGGKVTLADESDYDLAIETARETAGGKSEGKLEIYCSNN